MNDEERVLFKKLSEKFTFFKLFPDGDFYLEIGGYSLDNIDYFCDSFGITIYSDDDILDSHFQLNLNGKSLFNSRYKYSEDFFKELYDNGIEIKNEYYKKSAFLRKWRLDDIEL